MGRRLRFKIRNIWKEVLFTALCLFIGFIPVINLADPFIIFAIQSYNLAIGIMDYYMERQFTIGEAVGYANRHTFFVAGIAACFILTLLTSIIDCVLDPILATIACTEYGFST